MEPIKRILVGLDLSKLDEVLVQYSSMVAEIFDVDKIYFVHIAGTLELPERLKEKHGSLVAPVDETIQNEIRDMVYQYYAKGKFDIDIDVIEGKPHRDILHWSDVKNIDLIVMGRKSRMGGSGVIPSKVANQSHSSLLLIPERSPMVLNKVLVPINLDRDENLPLKQALAIADKKDIRIIGQNVYNVPSGYHTSGKTYEEFAKIMEGHADKRMKKRIKDYNLGDYNFNYELTLNDENDLPQKIYDLAVLEHADLIIMGAQAKTSAAAVLFGSIAEKLTEYDRNIPLLIVKDKTAHEGFLQALLKI